MKTDKKRIMSDSKMCLIIIFINSLVFIAQISYPLLAEFLQLYPDAGTIVPRSWTLVTVFFLHINPVHLLGTMFVVYYAGTRLEEVVGPRHLLYIYFVAGLTGSAAIIAASRLFTISEPFVGASAAALGILGASVVVPLKDEARGRDLQKVLIIVLATNIVVTFFDFRAMMGSTAAHFAGMAMGVVYGNLYKLNKNENLQEIYKKRAKGKPPKK